eukprot:s735_g26.t1
MSSGSMQQLQLFVATQVPSQATAMFAVADAYTEALLGMEKVKKQKIFEEIRDCCEQLLPLLCCQQKQHCVRQLESLVVFGLFFGEEECSPILEFDFENICQHDFPKCSSRQSFMQKVQHWGPEQLEGFIHSLGTSLCNVTFLVGEAGETGCDIFTCCAEIYSVVTECVVIMQDYLALARGVQIARLEHE